MKQILVNYPITKEKVEQDNSRELMWYDFIKKELLKFKGTKLKFNYKEDSFLVEIGEEERLKRGIKGTYRLLPEVENIEFSKIEEKKDKKEVEDFFKNYSNYNNNEIEIDYKNEEGIQFNVPEKEVEDFCHQLERNRFNYHRE